MTEQPTLSQLRRIEELLAHPVFTESPIDPDKFAKMISSMRQAGILVGWMKKQIVAYEARKASDARQ